MGSWADKSPVTGASGSTRILTRPGSGSPRSHTIPRQHPHPHPHPHPHASACTRPRPRSASEPVKVQDRQVAGRPLAAGGARGRASGQVPPADPGAPGPGRRSHLRRGPRDGDRIRGAARPDGTVVAACAEGPAATSSSGVLFFSFSSSFLCWAGLICFLLVGARSVFLATRVAVRLAARSRSHVFFFEQ